MPHRRECTVSIKYKHLPAIQAESFRIIYKPDSLESSRIDGNPVPWYCKKAKQILVPTISTPRNCSIKIIYSSILQKRRTYIHEKRNGKKYLKSLKKELGKKMDWNRRIRHHRRCKSNFNDLKRSKIESFLNRNNTERVNQINNLQKC